MYESLSLFFSLYRPGLAAGPTILYKITIRVLGAAPLAVSSTITSPHLQECEMTAAGAWHLAEGVQQGLPAPSAEGLPPTFTLTAFLTTIAVVTLSITSSITSIGNESESISSPDTAGRSTTRDKRKHTRRAREPPACHTAPRDVCAGGQTCKCAQWWSGSTHRRLCR